MWWRDARGDLDLKRPPEVREGDKDSKGVVSCNAAHRKEFSTPEGDAKTAKEKKDPVRGKEEEETFSC